MSNAEKPWSFSSQQVLISPTIGRCGLRLTSRIFKAKLGKLFSFTKGQMPIDARVHVGGRCCPSRTAHEREAAMEGWNLVWMSRFGRLFRVGFAPKRGWRERNDKIEQRNPHAPGDGTRAIRLCDECVARTTRRVLGSQENSLSTGPGERVDPLNDRWVGAQRAIKWCGCSQTKREHAMEMWSCFRSHAHERDVLGVEGGAI